MYLVNDDFPEKYSALNSRHRLGTSLHTTTISHQSIMTCVHPPNNPFVPLHQYSNTQTHHDTDTQPSFPAPQSNLHIILPTKLANSQRTNNTARRDTQFIVPTCTLTLFTILHTLCSQMSMRCKMGCDKLRCDVMK